MYHIGALLCLAALYDASHESKIVVGDTSVLLNIPCEPGVKKLLWLLCLKPSSFQIEKLAAAFFACC